MALKGEVVFGSERDKGRLSLLILTVKTAFVLNNVHSKIIKTFLIVTGLKHTYGKTLKKIIHWLENGLF